VHVVLLVLALIWAIFLIPQLLRWRAERAGADSVETFRNRLSVLGRTAPTRSGGARRLRALDAPPAASPAAPAAQARQRRREVFFGLLAAAGASFVLALLTGLQSVLVVHLLVDLLLLGYVALLVQARAVAEERQRKVRYLPPPAPEEPLLPLRRSASS
jgi:hypothetical protein